MKIEFTGRHIDVTPAIKEHVKNQFAKIEHLFNGRSPKAHVIIEVERGRHRSEVVLNWRNESFTATSKDSDMYKSLSTTIGKIEKQTRKLKDKVITKTHKAKRASLAAAAANAAKPDRSNDKKIIATKRYAVKPLTPEEAAMIVDRDKNGFLLFRDAESGGISLIHKRADGNYGLIQT